MFSWNNDSNDTTEEPLKDERDLAPLRGEINRLSKMLKEKRFYAKDRNDIAKEIGRVFYKVSQITEDAELEWIPPEENPTSKELALFLSRVNGVLTRDELLEDTSRDDISELQTIVTNIQQTVEEVSEFPYTYTELSVEQRFGKELQSIGIPDEIDPEDVPPTEDPEEMFAGPHARKAIEKAPRNNPGADLFVGTGTRAGRDISLPKDELWVHRLVLGLTGTGKSTKLTNDFKQLMESGVPFSAGSENNDSVASFADLMGDYSVGGCFIDPKGDDARRLVRILPEERLDDIIWIEPGGDGEYLSGFNFISMDIDPSEPHYDTAVSNLVDDMVKLLGAGEYWGERMDRVARNLITVMNKINEMTGDDAPDLTFVDLAYVLFSEASREEFAAMVKNAGMHFIDEYTQKITQLDESDLEPLIGRFLKWIRNDTARRMIGFREGSINISEAVEDGKIIIVRMGMENKDLKRMLGMAIIRRIWTTIRSRAEMDEYERDPFFLFCDEFDNLVLADETIPSMLSEARSYKLGMTLAMQYPGQVPEDIMDAMTTNCKTIEAFNPGDKKQASTFNNQLGRDPDTLTSEADFHYWMRRDQEGGMERSDSFRVYSYPPFPPKRTIEDRDQIIKNALREHGQEIPDREEEKQQLLYHHGAGRWETGLGNSLAHAEDDEERELIKQDLLMQAPQPEDLPLRDETASSKSSSSSAAAGISPDESLPSGVPKAESVEDDDKSEAEAFLSDHQETLLLSIYAVRVQQGKPSGAWVPTADAKEEFKRRVDDEAGTSLSEMSNLFEKLASGGNLAEWDRRDGESKVRLEPTGKAKVFEQDTGSSGSGGGDDHRWVLRETFAAFTRLGYITTLPEQEGEEQPDGLAEVPIDVTDVDDDLSPNEMMEAMEARREELREEYSGVWNLSGADNVSIEAETSTFTYPFQTFRNLRKSIERGDFCVLATKDGRNDEKSDGTFSYFGRRIEQVLYETTGPLRGGNKTIHHDNLSLMKHRDDDGYERFYTEGNHYKVVGDHKALRPTREDNHDETSWYRDPETDEIVACYSKNDSIPEDGEFARFENEEAVEEGDRTAVPAYYTYDQSDEEYIVRTRDGDKKFYQSKDELEANWERFNKPYIPETEFPRMPEEDDFLVLIFPDDDNPEYDQPQIYEQGELTPLFEAADANFSMPETTARDDLDIDDTPDENTEKAREPTESEAESPSSTTEEVVLDRENPPVCPNCQEEEMAAAALTDDGEVAMSGTPDDQTHKGWLCRGCRETQEPRPGIDSAPSEVNTERPDSDSGTGENEIVDNRLSAGALAATTMLSEEKCEAILAGEYTPRARHRDGIRKALESLRPNNVATEDLPPVFSEPWYRGEPPLSTSDPSEQDTSTPTSMSSETPSDKASASTDDRDSAETGTPDSTQDEESTDLSSSTDSDTTDEPADRPEQTPTLAEAEAVAGRERRTPRHRESLDAIYEQSDDDEPTQQSRSPASPVNDPDVKPERRENEEVSEADEENHGPMDDNEPRDTEDEETAESHLMDSTIDETDQSDEEEGEGSRDFFERFS